MLENCNKLFFPWTIEINLFIQYSKPFHVFNLGTENMDYPLAF